MQVLARERLHRVNYLHAKNRDTRRNSLGTLSNSNVVGKGYFSVACNCFLLNRRMIAIPAPIATRLRPMLNKKI